MHKNRSSEVLQCRKPPSGSSLYSPVSAAFDPPTSTLGAPGLSLDLPLPTDP